ncbi:MAG TPA: NUDIX domain-containing protein [Nitrospiria bacterium]|nr:NUDIX domain-containing protein [Nitrospiria bacterium]
MSGLTHAGGIVVRLQGDAPRYLVVTAKNDALRWVFPKGHIDPGETPEAAAEREVREEAGMDAKIVEAVGSVDFKKDGREARAAFFLMHYVRNAGPGEDRKRRWCPYEEALELLSSDANRDLLRRAHSLANKHLHRQGSAS